MAIISVEVPDVIASKFNKKEIITIERLYEADNSNWETVVDFWKDWLWKKEFMEYLSSKKN